MLGLSPQRTAPSLGASTLIALVLSVFSLSTASAAPEAKEGWGPPASFVGRYHVKVVQGGREHVVGGQLNLFMQEEFPGSQKPAGILKLRLRDGRNDLVYLTSLHHRGRGRGAEIHGGAFVGPKIGAFRGWQVRAGKLRATLHTKDLGVLRARFVRFSRKPTQ